MQLSGAVQNTRYKAILSQESFSNALKVTVSTINRWRNSKGKPNLCAITNLKHFGYYHELSFSLAETE